MMTGTALHSAHNAIATDVVAFELPERIIIPSSLAD